MGMGPAVARQPVAPNDASQSAVQRFVKRWIIVAASTAAVYLMALCVFAAAVR